MKAAIVTIGDEILIGQVVDTNSSFIAKSLDKIGIEVHEMISVSDSGDHITDTMKGLQNRVDLVIITGGLGPTKDDITKVTFCSYFDDVLVRNAEIEHHVVRLIEQSMNREASQINKDQALVPSKCIVLPNKVGTAPGMWMEKENTVFVSLPGVPYEMKYIMENELLLRLISRFKRPYIIHKTIMTYGQGESLVAERIEDWEDDLPDFIKLAYLPSPGRLRLRLTARGIDQAFLQKSINTEVEKLKAIINDIIVGLDEEESIEVVLGKLLKEKGLTIAVAESCTGGKIAETITSVPGSSAYFKGGMVTYATETKINVLKVSKEIIDTFSVVSGQVAQEMAQNVKTIMKADYGISTTGNAGPDKGDSGAEVGTVFIGIATPEGVYSEEFNFGEPREKVINRAVNKSLEIIYKEILKN